MTCGWCLPQADAEGTLRIFLLTGQSNMEGQAYTYDSTATAGWNVPTMQFLLSGTAAATTYVANMPYGFKAAFNSGWLAPRSDVWGIHYDSSNGSVKTILPTNNQADIVSGIQPMQPGFGVGTGNGSMIGPELAMGIRLGDASSDPILLFKSDKGGTTLGADWRSPAAVTARGGTVGINYTNTMTRFIQLLDVLDADLADNGMLDAYDNATAYQVAGVFWFQGWNEQFDDAPYTAAQLQAEYKDNLKDLIHSIRAADPRIGGGVGIIIGESADQNASLNEGRLAAVAELNGEIADSAAYFDTDNMLAANWGNNEHGAPFSTGWGYHFHARAENVLEIGWKAAGAVLDTGFLSPSPLWFATPVISGPTPDQATATAYLNADADAATVVWDTRDMGTGLTTAWAHQQSLGASAAGQVQLVLTGLAEGTRYTVRFHATSASLASETWSPPVTFITPWLNPPPLLGIPEISSVTSQGATLKCQLQQADAEVTLVWAYADQGDADVAAWTGAEGGGSVAFGTTPAGTQVTHTLTGLNPATAYAYRFQATNPYGTVWTAADGFGTKTASTGGGAASLVAYWNFDEFTPGPNPGFAPQAGTTGSFEDLSGHGNTAYAAELSGGAAYAPFAAGGGRFGGALYSRSVNNDGNGGMAVIANSDSINFNQEDFTISFWEKVKYRDVGAASWTAGRGRTQWFMKAPHITASSVEPMEGYGLNLTQNHFDLMANNSDNFGQTSLGARYTYPSNTPDDSNQWAHRALVGVYDPGSDTYAITTYLNGTAVTWNGGVTTVTVSNNIIDNPGNLTLGGFWRNNGNANQRCLSWNMLNPANGDTDGEGWLDDFALWESSLTEGDIADLASGIKGPLQIGVVAGYAGWAATHAPGQTASEDYDGDGMPNGIEYFMGITGTDPVFTANPILADGSITWPMDPAFSGSYQVQTSPDLDAWTDRKDDADYVTVHAGSVVCTLPAGAGTLFVRLVVTPN
jgi:hypothetical protein